MTQALAKERPTIPTEIIRDPRQFAEIMVDQQSQKCHVLGPLLVSAFGPSYGATLSIVHIDPSVNDKGQGPEVYYDAAIHTKDQRALGKVAIDKLAMAAGISWNALSGRTGPDEDPLYYQFTAVGLYTAFDGTPQQVTGTVALDFRDGGADIVGWSDKRIQKARPFIARQAETKAKLRAVRSALALRQKYTIEELKKPFVVPRAAFAPDMTIPAVAAAVASHALSGQSALYPQPALGVGDPQAIDAQATPAPEASASPDQSAADAVPEGAVAFSPDPLPPAVPTPNVGTFTITRVLQQEDVFLIGAKEISPGHFFVTDDMAIARDAHVAIVRPRRITYDGDGERRPIVSLLAPPDQQPADRY